MTLCWARKESERKEKAEGKTREKKKNECLVEEKNRGKEKVDGKN